MLSSVTIVAVVFAAWELIENHFFRELDYLTLHYLYITRGIACSLLLAVWAAWYVLRQRRHGEEELRRSRERYRSLLEISPGAIALYDAELRVVEWNASAESLYGFSKGEAVGRILPTLPREKKDELHKFLSQVTPILNFETTRRNQQGTTFDVELSLLPFREPDGQQYFLEVTADIRDRIRLRERLLELEKLTSMGRMAAGTAHHLNTPLTSMLLRVQMMRERIHHSQCSSDLEHIEEGVHFCQHFVQRLLQFSRRSPAEKQPTEIPPVVDSVVAFLSPAIKAKRASVSIQAAVDGRRVLADRNQLEALLSILLTNALDALRPGGTIKIAFSSPSSQWIELQIGDNGCGIPADQRNRIFEPFFTTKESGKGTGLGLAIARNIVLDHAGSIRLESNPGQGTTVVIQLPVFQACTTERTTP